MSNDTDKPEKSWPRAIIIAYTIFVCLTLGFVAFTFTVDFDLVVPDYYKQTLVYEDQIERIHNMVQLKEPLAVQEIGDQVQITFPVELLTDSLSGSIVLYRPSDASLDRIYSINPDSSGTQFIDGTDITGGLWILKINAKTSQKEFYGEYSVFLR